MTASQGEDIARQAVAGLFYPHVAPRVKEHACRDLKCLLTTADDHYLLGFAAQRWRGFQVACNGFPESLRTRRRGVLQSGHLNQTVWRRVLRRDEHQVGSVGQRRVE